MSKKKEKAEEVKVQEEVEEVQEEETSPETGQESTYPNTDFNLEDEYKPEPLMASGNYRGNVIGVVFNAEQNAIVWKVALDGNGGVMSDGETPIDGNHLVFRNWLPKPGDENEMTKDGKNSKRQSKINMLKRFADEMEINMNTSAIVVEAITNQDWVGLGVMVTISINEYNGITRNQVDRMVGLET